MSVMSRLTDEMTDEMSTNASAPATSVTERQVLVILRGHSRPLTLPSASGTTDADLLEHGVRNLFEDVLKVHPAPKFFVQLKDTNWGEFVDLTVGQTIPDRAVLRANIEEVGWCM